jgi:NTP pyrophosphatase (non-canonical NTP hydrolase)
VVLDQNLAHHVFWGLAALADCQGIVSGRVPGALDGSREAVTTYAYGLIEEIHETVREIGWKPWKDPTPPNTGRVVEEFADVLAFLGILTINLAGACNLTPLELIWKVAEQYEKTSAVNAQRFEVGREPIKK